MNKYSAGFPSVGVAYFIYGVHGFWWSVVYGLFWPTWAGYHLAHYLIGS
jgi:hypothetical protein